MSYPFNSLQHTGAGMPDFRLQFIHGTRFGGIRGYGIGWRMKHHALIAGDGRRRRHGRSRLLTPTSMTYHGAAPKRFTHETLVDTAPSETMKPHGRVPYDYRKGRYQPKTLGLRRHGIQKMMQTSSATPRTYYNSHDFEASRAL
eukprot:Seg3562.9 transcript_id=Seg3562.9/GoldUCD/mRNA.D3Y31 product="hypothetical protein" protein_id=Seg3562.9/GoldUCD/D3Y31